MYERESLSLEEVQSVLHSRALQNKLNSKCDTDEGIAVRGRTGKYNPQNKITKGRSRSKGKQLKYFLCHKKQYFKRGYPNRKTDKIGKTNENKNASMVMDGYKSA